MDDIPEMMKFVRYLFLNFDEKNFSFPKNFPANLYLNANKRTQKHVKKWVVVLGVLGGYSGTNNLLDLLEFWNKKHPEYKTYCITPYTDMNICSESMFLLGKDGNLYVDTT